MTWVSQMVSNTPCGTIHVPVSYQCHSEAVNLRYKISFWRRLSYMREFGSNCNY